MMGVGGWGVGWFGGGGGGATNWSMGNGDPVLASTKNNNSNNNNNNINKTQDTKVLCPCTGTVSPSYRQPQAMNHQTAQCT